MCQGGVVAHEEKQNWFKDNLGLKLENGIPSHDMLERIFAMVGPSELEKGFVSWVKAANKLPKVRLLVSTV